MARPKLPERFHLPATARTCLKKAEYAALGRHARLKNRSISSLLRELILAELALAEQVAR